MESILEASYAFSASTAELREQLPKSTSFANRTGTSAIRTAAWRYATDTTAVSEQSIPGSAAATASPESMATGAATGSASLHDRFAVCPATTFPTAANHRDAVSTAR